MRVKSKKYIISALALALAVSLASCGDGTANNGTETEAVTTSPPPEAVITASDDDMFTDDDKNTDYEEDGALRINLKGTYAEANHVSVKIKDSTATVTQPGTYIVSGTLDDGMIIVDGDDTAAVTLVLDGANITSKSSAAIYVKNAEKVYITLKGENSLSSGDSYAAIDSNTIDGTVFSKQDITFNGDGSLAVSSPAGHGIVGKDNVIFTGGEYSIVSAFHGVQANDSVRIKDSVISAETGKDGIHAENTSDGTTGYVYISSGTLSLECEGDGISSGAYMQIEGGDFDILAGGGYENGNKDHSDNFGQFGGRPGGMRPRNVSAVADTSDDSTSMKGIKSGGSMLIGGGTFKIDSADDALHSNVSLTVNGGMFDIASGDDAIHAEETLTVTDGSFNITNSYEGLEAHHITVSGGNIRLVSTDDGFNAAGGVDSSGTGGRDDMVGGRPGGMGGMGGNSDGSITVSGGTVYINSSGDGMDANGTVEITGGHTTVVGPTQGDTATLDFDVSATITGGTFIGTGASGMAQTFSSSSQGVIAISTGSRTAGTEITVKDKSGKEIIRYAPELSFQVLIVSTPDMKSGESYTVTVGTDFADVEAY